MGHRGAVYERSGDVNDLAKAQSTDPIETVVIHLAILAMRAERVAMGLAPQIEQDGLGAWRAEQWIKTVRLWLYGAACDVSPVGRDKVLKSIVREDGEFRLTADARAEIAEIMKTEVRAQVRAACDAAGWERKTGDE
jgi:hypothetical protein